MKRYKYRTAFGKFSGAKIEQFEVLKETDYFMTVMMRTLTTGSAFQGLTEIEHPHEHTFSKPFNYGWWFDTWEEARDEKLKWAKSELETARKELTDATNEVEKWLTAIKPEEK